MARHLAKPGFHFVRDRQNTLDVGVDQFAGRCQGNTAMPPFKQANAILLLQLLDLESHGWLRHEQGLGGAGKAEMLGYGMKDLQTPVSHYFSPRGWGQ